MPPSLVVPPAPEATDIMASNNEGPKEEEEDIHKD